MKATACDGDEVMRVAALLIAPLMLAGAGAALLQRGATATPGASAPAIPATGDVPPTVVGMNLGTPDYWSAQWTFDDLVQTTAAIKYVDPKGGWPDAQGIFSFDSTGHPIHIPKGTTLAVVLQNGALRLPVGSYDCAVADGWDVKPFGEWVMKGSARRFTMTVDRVVPDAGITLLLTATRDDAALGAMSCKRQNADDATPFNPAFLAEIRPYKVLRFMDWMRTNGAPKRSWADRPSPASFTQGGAQGVAIEHMVALANATGADPWFNMPFDAEPGYYAAFARYVRDHLDPRLKVYVEYSNEVWNEAFEQGKAATRLGRERYPDIDATTANDFYYADRVREVMGIWTQVFAGQRQRLVRVLANQAVWPDRAERALAHADTWKSVDALAIAPYFGIDPYALPGTGAARVDALFARAPELVGQSIGYAVQASKTARKYDIRMVTYEAGQHFVGYQKEVRAEMLAANRDPRIYDVYMSYLNRWKAEVGGLIVLFDSVSTPGPGGQFGHRDYTGQPLSDAPKARAVHDFMAQNAAAAKPAAR